MREGIHHIVELFLLRGTWRKRVASVLPLLAFCFSFISALLLNAFYLCVAGASRSRYMANILCRRASLLRIIFKRRMARNFHPWGMEEIPAFVGTAIHYTHLAQAAPKALAKGVAHRIATLFALLFGHNPAFLYGMQLFARAPRPEGVHVVACVIAVFIFGTLASTSTEATASIKPAPVRVNEDLQRITVRSGETLSKALKRVGVKEKDAAGVAAAVGRLENKHKLKAGQRVHVLFEPKQKVPMEISFPTSPTKQVLARRTHKGSYYAFTREVPLRRELVHVGGEINSSLLASTRKAGLSNELTYEMIRLFSYDVDFARDIHPGDSFKILYEHFVSEDGETRKIGNIAYGELKLRGENLRVYHFTSRDGSSGYFDQSGRSIQKSLMKTPIDGARLSSHYGMRKHPVLGYSKMHQGVDFAAPTGTPIYAAGDGVVEKATVFGGYGNYIRIRHGGEFDTAYAHLSRYAKGIRAGSRVKQGDVIGYVGTTGRSTGAHLHYEIIANGRQVNPLAMKSPPQVQLSGVKLARFKGYLAEIEDTLAQIPMESQLAMK